MNHEQVRCGSPLPPESPLPPGSSGHQGDSASGDDVEMTEKLQRCEDESGRVVGNNAVMRLLMNAMPWLKSEHSPAISFLLGVGGLNLILVVFAIVAAVGMYAAQDLMDGWSSFFTGVMTIVQTLILPPLVGFSFATVTPMFWYGSVFIRFAIGLLLVVPGCAAFYSIIMLVEGNGPDDFWMAFSVVMFSQFLVAGLLALAVQMWTPWTLTHDRGDATPIPPPGTRALLELTGVAAIGCTVFIWDGVGEFIEGVIYFVVIGGFSSFAVISVLIALLRKDRRNWGTALLSFAGCLMMTSVICGFFAIQEFGWNSVQVAVPIVAGNALYGATVASAVMWLCVHWLRLCGWECVNRNQEKARLSTSPAS